MGKHRSSEIEEKTREWVTIFKWGLVILAVIGFGVCLELAGDGASDKFLGMIAAGLAAWFVGLSKGHKRASLQWHKWVRKYGGEKLNDLLIDGPHPDDEKIE